MKLLFSRLTRAGFNRRRLTETDFYQICEAEGIEVIWSDRKYSFFLSILGERCIVLPKRLKGVKMLFSAFHELGHALAHVGQEPSVLWLGMPHSKDEVEADAVALIALMPIESDWMEILDGTRYARRLYDDRCRLHFLYGI